ncbi:MAG: hypothetical protein IPN85_13370 [Flavobacteriales bacterium]|nr:hypothetical protein [Flavobacteriales bacterium]
MTIAGAPVRKRRDTDSREFIIATRSHKKTRMKKVLIVVGTRPNFTKVTRFKKVQLNGGIIDLRIAYTGQHFSANMADVFFEQFGLTPSLPEHRRRKPYPADGSGNTPASSRRSPMNARTW